MDYNKIFYKKRTLEIGKTFHLFYCEITDYTTGYMVVLLEVIGSGPILLLELGKNTTV